MFRLVLVGLVALAGCGSARRSEPVAGPLELSASEARGEKVYARWCEQCHPGGEGGLGPSINTNPAPESVKLLQVRWGLGEMPAFDHETIPKRDARDLAAYMKALRKHE